MKYTTPSPIPCEVVFHPDWWHKHAGISFGEDYFFDPETRMAAELKHRQVLFEKFGSVGLGEESSIEKPVMGPVHLAAGFVVSAALGCEIRFNDDNPPEVLPRNMSDDDVMALEVPDVANTWPMNKLLPLMDALEAKYGSVEGDINWQGLLNTALDLRGQSFMMDYYTNPDLVKRLLDVIYETTLETVNLIRKRTGTSSMAVNRVVGVVDPAISMHSNCSVTMISQDTYDEFHLPYELKLANALRPYGIHHCGNDMEKVAESYAKTDPMLLDVGWGSDIALCREKLPNAILSLRIDPVQMNKWTPDDVEREVSRCIEAAGPRDQIAVCCINMDKSVPEENVFKLFETVEKHRK